MNRYETKIPEKCCCSCEHNERKNGECYCNIDGYYIGYVQCFLMSCKHWKRDRKWDK